MGEIFHPDFEGKGTIYIFKKKYLKILYMTLIRRLANSSLCAFTDEPLMNDKIFSCKPCPRQRFTVLESPLKDNLR